MLTDAGRNYLAAQLAQVAPVMPDRRDTIRALGVDLPAHLNQASFHALWHGDSKSGIDPDNDAIDITLTQDEVIRLRTLSPLSLIDQDGLRHDMRAQLAPLGELVLPERCLSKLHGIEWQGRQLVTVENKELSWITRCKWGVVALCAWPQYQVGTSGIPCCCRLPYPGPILAIWISADWISLTSWPMPFVVRWLFGYPTP